MRVQRRYTGGPGGGGGNELLIVFGATYENPPYVPGIDDEQREACVYRGKMGRREQSMLDMISEKKKKEKKRTTRTASEMPIHDVQTPSMMGEYQQRPVMHKMRNPTASLIAPP